MWWGRIGVAIALCPVPCAPLAAAMASREQARVGQEYAGLFVDKELQEVCHPDLQLIIGRTE